jgi:hypothetical protein
MPDVTGVSASHVVVGIRISTTGDSAAMTKGSSSSAMPEFDCRMAWPWTAGREVASEAPRMRSAASNAPAPGLQVSRLLGVDQEFLGAYVMAAHT